MSITPSHAGAVAFRKAGDRTFYLIVASSDGAHWVLPKGHIEPGEAPERAALRELKEEAGIAGEIVECLRTQSFRTAKEEVVVQYFLVRATGAAAATEQRSRRWEGEQEALRLLTFPEAQAALREAIASLSGPETAQ